MNIHEQVAKEISEMHTGKKCCTSCKYVGTVEESRKCILSIL